MNDHQPAWIRLLPFALFLLLLAGAAVASLTIIDLRQEEGRLAASTIKLRSEITATGRRLQEMLASVAAAEQPTTLRTRVGTRLAPMTDKQIVWVSPGAAAPRFEASRSASLSDRFVSAEPATISRLLP